MSDAAQALCPELALESRQKAASLSYRDVGNGEIVVLIHGVGLNADAWRPQIDALSLTHRVIAIDMPGHGDSDRLARRATLADFVEKLAEFFAALDIKAASIVGHSMGGLVAIGFALAHPHKTLRLAVLNSVYRRSAEKRQAVEARAREIAGSGTVGNIEDPLERWFGKRGQWPGLASDVRTWLASVDPQGYATAYGIFAASDRAFAGRLHELTMPCLFATGSLDQNSSPEMATSMAEETRHGSSLILEGERHLMNLTRPEAVNQALLALLRKSVSPIDAKDLRKAFGAFMTGVTVVTTRESNGTLRGFTANSFSSVSLDPPLLLVCLSKASACCESFSKSPHFAVNILAENQKDVSGIFASKRPDKFSDVPWTESNNGNPLLTGSVAWFDCDRHQVVDAGDHVILVGRVTSYGHDDAAPLGYARGGYFTLGLEQSAVDAASQGGKTEVGAILECDGKLLVARSAKDDSFELPHIGERTKPGSASQLIASMAARGVRVKLGFLFAVFENPQTQVQSIFYRGDAEMQNASGFEAIGFDDVPYEKFKDDAVKSMLRRYCAERLQGRYRIYSGDHVSGEVKELSE